MDGYSRSVRHRSVRHRDGDKVGVTVADWSAHGRPVKGDVEQSTKMTVTYRVDEEFS